MLQSTDIKVVDDHIKGLSYGEVNSAWFRIKTALVEAQNTPANNERDVILLCDYKDRCNWKHIELSNGKVYCMCRHCKTTPVS